MRKDLIEQITELEQSIRIEQKSVHALHKQSQSTKRQLMNELEQLQEQDRQQAFEHQQWLQGMQKDLSKEHFSAQQTKALYHQSWREGKLA